MTTPIRTSKADANWFSISANTYQFFAGTPDVKSVDYPPTPPIFGTDTPAVWDSYLKVCDGTKGVRLAGIYVKQGNENAIDLNNGVSDCSFVGDFGWGGGSGDQVITVKGGCHDVTFGGVIYSHGHNADVVINAWSDQSAALCSNLDFSNLTRADGQPITYVLGRFGSRAKWPAGAEKRFWLSLGYSLYWLGKRAAVKAGLIKGVK